MEATGCVDKYEEIYCELPACTIMETEKSKILRAHGLAADPEESQSCMQLSGKAVANTTPSCSERSALILFRPLTDGMRHTHTMEGNMLYLESTDLNVSLTQKHVRGGWCW